MLALVVAQLDRDQLQDQATIHGRAGCGGATGLHSEVCRVLTHNRLVCDMGTLMRLETCQSGNSMRRIRAWREASRRRRGPVALRPRLSPGVPLSRSLRLKASTDTVKRRGPPEVTPVAAVNSITTRVKIDRRTVVRSGWGKLKEEVISFRRGLLPHQGNDADVPSAFCRTPG
jgi:hypothetical protein